MIPVLGFSAFSGAGKTTLMEQLVVCLKAKGLRTAVIKHDVHGVSFDCPGKDSARYTAAGADQVILAAPGNTVEIDSTEHSLSTLIGRITGVDMILVEGYKYAQIPQIGIRRMESGKELPLPPESYLAVVSDQPFPDCPVPCFHPDSIHSIAEFMIQNMTEFTCPPAIPEKQTPPSLDLWLRQAKSDPRSPQCGMYLFHNGVVRQSSKAQVRLGKQDEKPVCGMFFSYDEKKVASAIQTAKRMPGIFHVRVWLNQGELAVGDDLMLVLVGGDIRPHVVSALQTLLETLKNDCIIEEERRGSSIPALTFQPE